MEKQLPRTIRNCNPLAITKSDRMWLGAIYPGEDSTYLQFVSMEMGVRAAVIYLKELIRKKKVQTISSIISEWSVFDIVNEANYISWVCEKCKWPPSQRIDIKNGNHVAMLLHAMAWALAGQEIPMHHFLNGYALAINSEKAVK